jgi:hypothetical protein
LLIVRQLVDVDDYVGVHIEGEGGGRAALGHLQQAQDVGNRVNA